MKGQAFHNYLLCTTPHTAKQLAAEKTEKRVELLGSIWTKPDWFAESARTHEQVAALDSAEAFPVLISRAPKEHLMRTPATWPKPCFPPSDHRLSDRLHPPGSYSGLLPILRWGFLGFSCGNLPALLITLTEYPASQVNASHPWYTYSRRTVLFLGGDGKKENFWRTFGFWVHPSEETVSI